MNLERPKLEREKIYLKKGENPLSSLSHITMFCQKLSRKKQQHLDIVYLILRRKKASRI